MPKKPATFPRQRRATFFGRSSQVLRRKWFFAAACLPHLLLSLGRAPTLS
jgi:hypothetical protein